VRISNSNAGCLVLVLIGIGSVALLLPHVARVRRAAARTLCQNNMKEIALALNHYGNDHPEKGVAAQFPMGTIAKFELAPDQRLAWTVELLPYIGLDDIYRRINLSVGWSQATDSQAIQSPLKYFHCDGWILESNANLRWFTSYTAVAGVGLDAPSLASNDAKAGVFGFERQTALSELKSPSTTLTILETMQSNGPWGRGGQSTTRGLDPADRPYLGEGRQFGGMHFRDGGYTGRGDYFGCNAAFADGTVRALTNSISDEILEALVTKGGGSPDLFDR
jgi:hypothetical protein